MQVQFCTDFPVSDVLGVRECSAELLEPQPFGREDFIKFVSSLALSVHVEASLRNVEEPTSVAILVGVACMGVWCGSAHCGGVAAWISD